MKDLHVNAESMVMSPLKSANNKLQQHIAEVYKRLSKAIPNPRCELYYKTPYQLLVAVVLSANTTDKGVNSCTTSLFDEGFDPWKAVELGAAEIEKKIRRIGLAPAKSKYVFQLSKILIEKYKGDIPTTREELQALPGVGRKTANVVLGEIFRQPTLAVDTHVFRVSQRLGWQKEKSPEKAELALLKIIPSNYLPQLHHLLVLHGRYVCKALKPQCPTCPLNDICPSAII